MPPVPRFRGHTRLAGSTTNPVRVIRTLQARLAVSPLRGGVPMPELHPDRPDPLVRRFAPLRLVADAAARVGGPRRRVLRPRRLHARELGDARLSGARQGVQARRHAPVPRPRRRRRAATAPTATAPTSATRLPAGRGRRARALGAAVAPPHGSPTPGRPRRPEPRAPRALAVRAWRPAPAPGSGSRTTSRRRRSDGAHGWTRASRPRWVRRPG